MKVFIAHGLRRPVFLASLLAGWGLVLAPPAQAQAPEDRPLLSVVTIRNTTPEPVAYRIRWPGGKWQTTSLEPNRGRIHWTAGQGKRPEIHFRAGFFADSPEKVVRVTAGDFVRGNRKPTWADDGMIYAFTYGTAEEAVYLQAVTPLDKQRFRHERRRLETEYQNSHPNLLTNYEVLGPSSAKRTFNCIAWTLGITDRWVWPGDRVEDFDRLYTKHGYRRLPELDYRLRAGVSKIVLYAKTKADGNVECTHCARQDTNGTWTSKIGKLALIRHLRPEDVSGPYYGVPIAVYVKQAEK